MTEPPTGSRRDQLVDALWNPAVEEHSIHRAHEYQRYVRVQDILEVVRRSIPDGHEVEEQLDALVTECGGFRYEMIDPGQWLLGIARKLIGREIPPSEDYYGLPPRPTGASASEPIDQEDSTNGGR